MSVPRPIEIHLKHARLMHMPMLIEWMWQADLYEAMLATSDKEKHRGILSKVRRWNASLYQGQPDTAFRGVTYGNDLILLRVE